MNVLNAAFRELAVRGCLWRRTEELIAQICSAAAGESVSCWTDGVKSPYSPSGAWFNFLAENGYEFGLSFPERKELEARRGYFCHSIRLAAWAAGLGKKKRPWKVFLCPGFSGPEPFSMQQYFLETSGALPEKLYYAENYEIFSCCLKDERRGGKQLETSAGRETMKTASDFIDEKSTLPVELALGNLEIGFEDLLSLGPGVNVQFDCPESFAAVLKVAGRDWVNVRMKIVHDRICLETLAPEGENGKTPSARKLPARNGD